MLFYSEVLKLASERLEEYRAGEVPFPSVRMNSDTIIDFFPKKMWQETSIPGQGNKMSKERWEDLMEQLKTSKVDIEEGPARRWGAHGKGTAIYFRDPEGNLIEARYYEETQ